MVNTDTAKECGAERPGDGHPETGIPHCTRPKGHEPADEHGAPYGKDGWTKWGGYTISAT